MVATNNPIIILITTIATTISTTTTTTSPPPRRRRLCTTNTPAAATPATTIRGASMNNLVLNMALMNQARGFHVQPDRQRILHCIGQADFDTLVTAYTADVAARPDVANRNSLGAAACNIL